MPIRCLHTFPLYHPHSIPLSGTSVPPRHPKMYVHTVFTLLDELMNLVKLPLDNAEPFHPPNLIQSPAASFLSILESSTHAIPATLLLLPSAHIQTPMPSELEGRFDPELREEWEPHTLAKLHRIVGSILGIDSSWSVQHLPDRSTRLKASHRGDIGEGGMYI